MSAGAEESSISSLISVVRAAEDIPATHDWSLSWFSTIRNSQSHPDLLCRSLVKVVRRILRIVEWLVTMYDAGTINSYSESTDCVDTSADFHTLYAIAECKV